MGTREDAGKMGAMPSRTRPAHLPGEVRAVIQVMGSEVRTELMRTLHAVGESSTADLAQSVGASESAALRHLKDLEVLGLVTGHRRRGMGRAGVRIMWTLNAERVEEVAGQWTMYVLHR